ncbi:carbonic anhydrase [Cytobacillus firmus]|nr:carbonic anhydrase [Cytobacillus firmus]MBG9553699.1 carbonic anhydrase [Cytobacillus firmus]MBG9575173.1 carbonic anhydrase [Cytobacillus firmus]
MDNPKRYTEKLQWCKIHYSTPLMSKCSDKFEVREYIQSKGCANILNELYGVFSDVNEIDFNKLPNSFVLKANNGSGTNVFVKDKNSINIEEVKRELKSWLRPKKGSVYREMHYCDIEPKIVIEKLLKDNNNPDESINDYKFLCFNGEAKYVVLDVDRFSKHKRNIYDTQWNYLGIDTDCRSFGDVVPKPEGLEEMLKVANILSRDFPAVRVDLYWIDGRVYFGEMTFFPWSGFVNFSPDNFDFVMGEKFKLPI